MNQTTSDQPTVLAEALWSQANLMRELIFIVAGSLLVALTAQINIPLWPVPVTGQTFGVLLVAALLGRRSALSLLLYLLEGAAGLPVFAEFSSGVATLMGPTGGYLVGFVAAAFVVGWLCEQGWDRRAPTAVTAMLLGNVIIYAFGLLRLAGFVAGDSVWQLGLIPFIPGDILKILLAVATLRGGWRLAKMGRGTTGDGTHHD